MKYLVLGSSGQILKPFCKYLREQKHEVFELDIINGPEQDLRYINSITKANYFRNADMVIFGAFNVGGSKYLSKFEKTTEFLNHNVDLMRSVFKTLEEYRLPFLFLSSQMSNMNHSPYGILKRLGEFYTNILGGVNVKFWNVFGYEGNDQEKWHVITDFINSATKNGYIKCMTTGNEERQFLHTQDCSKALYTLAKKYSELDRTQDYDITSFQWNTIKEVAQCIANVMPGVVIETSTKIDNVQNGYRNIPSKYILKYWQPELTLSDGIKLVMDEMGVLK